MLTCEMQGNVIDLCPVGALTSKPYAFTARPWELNKTESIDVMDALGSNVRVDAKGREVMRIMPRNHDGVNEEWLADRSRFIWDGLRRQRLDRPYVRKGGKLAAGDLGRGLRAIAAAAKGKKVAGLVGRSGAGRGGLRAEALVEGPGRSVECRTDGAALPAGTARGYAGTATIADIDGAKGILLIGTNPRVEAPVLNARLRKAWPNGASIRLIGEAVDLTYPYDHLGTGREALGGCRARSATTSEGRAVAGDRRAGRADRRGRRGGAGGGEAFCAASRSKLLVLHTAASASARWISAA